MTKEQSQKLKEQGYTIIKNQIDDDEIETSIMEEVDTDVMDDKKNNNKYPNLRTIIYSNI